MSEREWTFAVYASDGKRGRRYRAYSLWFNTSWEGFVGKFTVRADNRPEALRRAIDAARAHERAVR